MRPKAFRVKRDSQIEPLAKKGTVVYDLVGHDYGLASDDTRVTGKEHTSVTLKPDGGYPSFTIPVDDLEEV
jgi:hypothetical protein